MFLCFVNLIPQNVVTFYVLLLYPFGIKLSSRVLLSGYRQIHYLMGRFINPIHDLKYCSKKELSILSTFKGASNRSPAYLAWYSQIEGFTQVIDFTFISFDMHVCMFWSI